MKMSINILLAFVFVMACSPAQNKGFVDADVKEFKEMMTKDNTMILDVRTPQETAEGMIEGAIEIDYKADGFDAKLDQLDKNKTYLVYCKSGGRSGRTANKMIDKGFKNVVNLKGGYTAWSK